jgi:hypothetical protein
VSDTKCGFCGEGHRSYRCTSGNAEKQVTIEVSLTVPLQMVNVFHDGPPEDPDGWDVLELIQDYSSLQSWVRDWSIGDQSNVTIQVEGKPTVTGTVW